MQSYIYHIGHDVDIVHQADSILNLILSGPNILMPNLTNELGSKHKSGVVILLNISSKETWKKSEFFLSFIWWVFDYFFQFRCWPRGCKVSLLWGWVQREQWNCKNRGSSFKSWCSYQETVFLYSLFNFFYIIFFLSFIIWIIFSALPSEICNWWKIV